MELLNKTMASYFSFSAVLLLAAIPVFYFALKTALINTADEELLATKTRIMPQLRDAVINHDQGSLSLYGYDIAFEKEQPTANRDSMYSAEQGGFYSNKQSPSRLLASHFTINQEFYSLRIQTSLADKLSLIKRIILILAFLLVFLLLGLLAINRILTKKIWHPFYTTLKRLQDYRVDKQPVLQLEPASVKEFNDLNLAIELLTVRNHQVYTSQKEFTENASHEMQSPLAVFQSKLELLMQTKPLSEDQATLITDLANASKRMSRLNKSLVLLTKIENNQFLEKESLSVKDILQRLLQQYEFQIAQHSIRVVFNHAMDITVNASRTLMEILLGNLLSNAIRHNVPNGVLEISIHEKELLLQNSGRPSPLDTEKLFQRFQKSGPNPDSIGLGLEIAKRICVLYHYSIEYRFTGSMHAFSIRF